MTALTTSISRRDDIFGRDKFHGSFLEFDGGVTVPNNNRNICGVFSESRSSDTVSAQAIIEVAAKAAFIDFAAEIFIGRGARSMSILIESVPPTGPMLGSCRNLRCLSWL